MSNLCVTHDMQKFASTEMTWALQPFFVIRRALQNVADEGLLLDGFFWIPSLAGPGVQAGQKVRLDPLTLDIDTPCTANGERLTCLRSLKTNGCSMCFAVHYSTVLFT